MPHDIAPAAEGSTPRRDTQPRTLPLGWAFSLPLPRSSGTRFPRSPILERLTALPMALIRTFPLIADIRGSQDGITVRLGPTGLVATPRYRARRARSPAQAGHVAALTACVHRWSSVLTNAQRAAWRFARISPETARTAYLSENAIRMIADLQPVDLPPALPLRLPSPDPEVEFTAVYSPPPNPVLIGYTITLLATGELPGPNEHWLLDLLHPWPASQIHPRTWTKQSWRLDGPLEGNQILTVDPPWYPGLQTALRCRRIGTSTIDTHTNVFLGRYSAGAPGRIIIAGIPQTHKHILLVIHLRSKRSVSLDYAYVLFNADFTWTNYWMRGRYSGATDSNVTLNRPLQLRFPGDIALSNSYTDASVFLPLYAGNEFKATYCTHGSHVITTSTYHHNFSASWLSIAPTTRIDLYDHTIGPNMTPNSWADVYLIDGPEQSLSGRASRPALLHLTWPV